MEKINGLHHITAITRDAQKNIDFYRNVLGQRLVKKTVNFDDPGAYHFYFADAVGTPGTVLTFFAWTGIKPGTRGTGAANTVAYNVPDGSLGFWQEYLQQNGIQTEAIEPRFGEEVLPFDDPDGMRIELVAGARPVGPEPWAGGPVHPRHALQGFHSATLWLDVIEPTARVLTESMGYTFSGQEDNRYRYTGSAGALGSVIDLLQIPVGSGDGDHPLVDRLANRHAVLGGGSIHHIAFRVPNDALQLEYQQRLRDAGLSVTPVQDRSYFHSIYYREPGGVLFEIATQVPGFAIDEPVAHLGEALMLPPWLEPHRSEIAELLPPVSLKPVQKAAYDLQK